MAVAAAEKGSTVSRFVELAQEKSVAGPGWFRNLQDAALERFADLGFPTRKDEDWRQTNISRIDLGGFVGVDSEKHVVPSDQFDANGFTDLGAIRAVFLNGRLSPDRSRLEGLPEGVTFKPLSQALAQDESLLREWFDGRLGTRERVFSALNLALCEEGLVLRVPRGVVVESPIHLVFHNHAPLGASLMTHPRVLVVAEENSQLCLLETHLGTGEGNFLNNGVTEILAKDNAVVDYYKIQQEANGFFHMGTVEAYQGRNATVRTSIFSLSGGLIRNETGAVLAGEGGNAELDGLFMVAGEHHVDNFTRIEHAAPHCGSRELYKGILMDRGTGVFRGRIIVHKGAQQTDSKQTNNNLLLSDQALVNTKPQLEIYADDVKCTHGATIGQLDADSLFYLRARGISLESAKSMLIYAFAGEVVSRVKPEALHKALDHYLFSWLPMARSLEAQE